MKHQKYSAPRSRGFVLIHVGRMPRVFGREERIMRRITSVLFVAVFVLGISGLAMAGPRGINHREYREQQRINQGIRSGELTRHEAERLEAGMAKIRTDERFDRMSGGGINRRERAQLNRELNRESRGIYHQKHDGQERNP